MSAPATLVMGAIMTDFGFASCLRCGQPFRLVRRLQSYCGEQCRDAAKKARRRAKEAGTEACPLPDTLRSGDALCAALQPTQGRIENASWSRPAATHVPVPGDGMVAGVVPTSGIRLRTHGGPYQDMPELPAFLDRRPAKLSRAA